jgi:hypothetical protein
MGAIVAVAAVAVGVSWLRPVQTSGAPEPAVSARAAAPTTSTSVVPEVGEVRAVEVHGLDVDRDGERWRVGEPGDLVAVGDWDCDGTSTPAVLRPSEARLFLFAGWDESAPAVAGPAAPADAVGFRAAGCGQAEVETPGASPVVIETMQEEGR